MFKTSRNALLAVGLAATLTGLFTSAASATPGQVCYFGECRESVAPAAAPTRSVPSSEIRTPVKIGNWSAITDGTNAMFVADFGDGAKFVIVLAPGGKQIVQLSAPRWRLKAGEQAPVTIRIDGKGFQGTAVATESGFLQVGVDMDFLQAFYHGQTAVAEAGGDRFTMNDLGDAAAVMDYMTRYLTTAAR
jgi:hypothetical protein